MNKELEETKPVNAIINTTIVFYEEPPKEISELLHIWYEREKPILMGKQIMTQSFYFKSLVGRKSIDIIPSHNDDNLYLLLEGNLKVKLD